MHDRLSRNQLAEWHHFEETVDRCNDELDLINDYFDCLIDCDDNANQCRQVCSQILK